MCRSITAAGQMGYGPSGAGINGFRRAGSIVWTHSSPQEKTRVDSLALSSLELCFAIAGRSKGGDGPARAAPASQSAESAGLAGGRPFKDKEGNLTRNRKNELCPNRF